MNLKISISILFLLILNASPAQSVEKIKFKKQNSLLYFFQKGAKSDTIVKNKSDLFYLVVPDTLKDKIIIFVDNGQLLPTPNDSIVKLNFVRGFNYESLFLPEEQSAAGADKKKQFHFKTLVNGTSLQPINSVRFKIVNKKEDGVIIENVFFYHE